MWSLILCEEMYVYEIMDLNKILLNTPNDFVPSTLSLLTLLDINMIQKVLYLYFIHNILKSYVIYKCTYMCI